MDIKMKGPSTMGCVRGPRPQQKATSLKLDHQAYCPAVTARATTFSIGNCSGTSRANTT